MRLQGCENRQILFARLQRSYKSGKHDVVKHSELCYTGLTFVFFMVFCQRTRLVVSLYDSVSQST